MNTNKKTKLIAVVLTLILTISMFAGCSMSDRGYIALYMEQSKIKVFTQTSDISLEVNPNVINPYAEEKSDPIKMNFNIVANGELTDEDVYCDMKIKFGINDTKMPYEANLILSDQTLLTPVGDVLNFYRIIGQFDGLSDKMHADINAALKKEFSGYDYVIFNLADAYSAENGMMVGPGSSAMMSPAFTSAQIEVGEIIIEAFMEMFKNLDSGMTKSVPNGFALEITPDNMFSFFDNAVNYISKNKKDIYLGTVKILEDLEKHYAADEAYAGYFEEAIEALVGDEQSFYAMIDEFTQGYLEMNNFEKEMAKLYIKGSYLKDTITKSGGTYVEDFDINLVIKGDQFLSAKGKTKTTPVSTVSHKDIDMVNPISMEEAIEIITKTQRKVNHATAMEMTWWNGEDYGISTSVQLVEGETWAYLDGFIQNGSLYLPLRDFCDWFAEGVAWDNAAKKAYVVRDDQKIETEGMLNYKTFYVKVREFEKLGYKVSYQYDKEWQEHLVTIEKH